MATHPNRNFFANLPILDGKNYDDWCKQMKVIFGYQVICDLVQNGLTPISGRATNEESRSALKGDTYNQANIFYYLFFCYVVVNNYYFWNERGPKCRYP